MAHVLTSAHVPVSPGPVVLSVVWWALPVLKNVASAGLVGV